METVHSDDEKITKEIISRYYGYYYADSSTVILLLTFWTAELISFTWIFINFNKSEEQIAFLVGKAGFEAISNYVQIFLYLYHTYSKYKKKQHQKKYKTDQMADYIPSTAWQSDSN